MPIESIAVTGGNGRLGRAVIDHLNDHGYRTINVNRGKDAHGKADAFCSADLTDPGDVHGAFARESPDAVAHLGMIPTPDTTPGHETFESNAMSPYYVLEAASAAGVEAVCQASSLSALGAGFEPDPVDVRTLPLTESHPLTPSTPYGMGKQALEHVGDGFARRADGPTRIASIRFPWVTDEEMMREHFVDTDRRLDALRETGAFHTARNTLFTYLALADAVRAVRRTLEADYAGHERFWTSAPDTNTETPTETLLDEVYPDAAVEGSLGGHDALVSTEKARRILDWEPERSWRDLRA